ncbi:unnamed protein product [Jaminaea pallidilutea]
MNPSPSSSSLHDADVDEDFANLANQQRSGLSKRPPSILRSSLRHPASRPGTPDNSSIHFSSGNHPEHHAASSAQPQDGGGSGSGSEHHPASRPASLSRRISDDSTAAVPATIAGPSSADSTQPHSRSSTPPVDVTSSANLSSENVAGDEASANQLHGILKQRGLPNYGGRPGLGPPLPSKNQTSSSGALSSVSVNSAALEGKEANYERRVGFDSMVDADETASGTFGFTLQVKSHGYRRTRNTRTFMCAVDSNAYSERALEWLMESLVEDNDEIVTITVLEGDPDEIDQEHARDAAKELMSAILTLNEEVRDRKISIVVEFVAGRVTSTITRLIHMYRPDSLTIGTRGRTHSTLQKLMGGAMIGGSSRDILATSPVPVVVVRPEAKVAKHLRARQADPKRRSYHALVAKAEESDLPLTKPRSRSSRLSAAGPMFHLGGSGRSSGVSSKSGSGNRSRSSSIDSL